ncbi:hypothetical protein G7K_2538-t1 [Saitoella complicata NRRL Y-17804]|uniref:Uncharacterized protein n=1 Tax=Saitoella complicata (strain BCRC 22490 / CBS 7301 / JCM 7358 / NBRC 10748 / NRRL Y-17804) TaxID=698492 RepID=A0A0E9NG56_SAICN|nr:hypothetical protein G7K_2538-t1 [Saitoella complicata NRRL Y-17804]
MTSWIPRYSVVLVTSVQIHPVNRVIFIFVLIELLSMFPDNFPIHKKIVDDDTALQRLRKPSRRRTLVTTKKHPNSLPFKLS